MQLRFNERVGSVSQTQAGISSLLKCTGCDEAPQVSCQDSWDRKCFPLGKVRHRPCSRMRAAGAREQPQEGSCSGGICHCPPWFLENGAIKLHLLLELCPPHHQTCKWPLCSHTFDSLSPVLIDRYMGEVRSCHGRTASWGHGARTRCLPRVGASGRGGVDAPVAAGRLAVQLLNLAGTDLHQSYGCVWGTKSLVGFD